MFYSFKKNLIITNIVTFVFAIVIIMIIVTIVVATKGMFVFIFVVTIVTFILYFEKKWRESMTKRKKQRLQWQYKTWFMFNYQKKIHCVHYCYGHVHCHHRCVFFVFCERKKQVVEHTSSRIHTYRSVKGMNQLIGQHSRRMQQFIIQVVSDLPNLNFALEGKFGIFSLLFKFGHGLFILYFWEFCIFLKFVEGYRYGNM